MALALGVVVPLLPGIGSPAGATVASPPTGVSASAIAEGARVAWTAPAGVPAPDGYRVTPIAAGDPLASTTIASQATAARVRGLPSGVVIRFTVAAVDGGGTGSDSTPTAPVVLPWGSLTATVDGLYLELVGRPPTAAERAAGVDLLRSADDIGPLVAALRDGSAPGSDALTVVDPVARLYFAYFLRAPDPGGLDFWIRRKRAGATLYAISASFASSSEFVRRYGALSDEGFVLRVYENVMGRAPDATGLAYWTGQVVTRRKTRGHVMASFSESSEYRRRQARRVDVAVLWNLLAGRRPDDAALARWIADLDAGRATLGDLAVAALDQAAADARWFCLPHPPQTVAEQRLLLNHHDDRWRIADNARSVALPDGRILWIFADTLYGKVNADGTLPATGWGFTHGSALIQDGACIEPFYSATVDGPTSLIPDVSRTDFFWPQSGWVDATGTTLWMVAGERIGEPSGGGVDGGTVVARFSLPDLVFQGVTHIPRPPRGKGLSWGVALHDGPWVYVYTDSGPDPETSWAFDHSVARFPDSGTAFLNGTGWQYWTGTGWSTSSANLKGMTFPASYLGVTSVIRSGSRFVLVTKPYKGAVPSAVAYTSSSPAGPWTKVGTVADLSAVPDGRTYAVHGESTVPGIGPFVVWSQSSGTRGSMAGAQVGVAAPLLPLG